VKKVIALALAAVLTLGSVATVLADNRENANGNEYYNSNEYYNGNENEYYNGNDYDVPALPLHATRFGYITEFDEETNVATMECEEFGKVLLFLDDVAIIEAYDGSAAGNADLEGVRAKAVIPPFGALIYPPQFTPFVLIVNAEYLHEAPQYHVVEALEWEDDDTLLITVDRGGLVIRLERETPLEPHLIRIMKHLETISVGDEMLFWYSIVGMSYPAQATATRALWLREGQEYEDANDNDYGYEYPEYEPGYDYPVYVYETEEPVCDPLVVAGQGVMRYGAEFFPVRAAAVAACFDVVWDGDTSSATLTRDGLILVLYNDSSYLIVENVAISLPAPIFIEDGVMYAPYKAFGFFR